MSGFNPSQSIPIKLPQKKHKILFLSDHPLATSGVGVQARMLIEGLMQTGKYTFRCLGGAIKHADYNVMAPHSDFIIRPVDGFGTKEMLRNILLTERPDALVLFTDPRQFIWVWEMEDEIRQLCPIAYWHVWDNDPYPAYNDLWYRSTDLINCLSYKTYELVKPNFPEKTHYIPHSWPKTIYFPLEKQIIEQLNKEQFPDKADWFKVLWVNRNAARKMPAEILNSWKLFLDDLEKKYGHRKAVMIMHTDPSDIEGPNLMAVGELFGILDNVLFSTEKLQFSQMNALFNMVDTTINISKNEGFGLLSLSTLQCGKPVIALCTGGMTRQVVDYRDQTENGVALWPVSRQLVGSQLVPYIYEDFSNHEEVSKAFMKIYEMTPEEKEVMKKKVIEYVDHEFNYDDMIYRWDETLGNCISEFKKNLENNKPKWTSRIIESHRFKPQTKEPISKTMDNVPSNDSIKKQKSILKMPTSVERQILENKMLETIPVDITGHLLQNVVITKDL